MPRLILFLLTLTLFIPASSQSTIDWESLKFRNDTTDQSIEYKITIDDGTIIYGELLRLTSDQLIVETQQFGELRLDIDKIKAISNRGDAEDGERYNMAGVNHYMLAPTPYGIKKNEFNAQVSEVFLISGWYGFTDNFSLGGGSTVLPGLGDNQVRYLIPKFSFELAEYVQASILFTNIFVSGESSSLLSMSLGIGKPDNHFSFGYSTPLSEDDGGAINLGGIARFSNKFALLGDTFIFTEADEVNLFTIGCRFIGESSSFDFGFVSLDGVSIPWVNYTIRF
ncbi:MAG: hypothetical protein RIM99_06035 [Cyclobacteriaceae bacterium]